MESGQSNMVRGLFRLLFNRLSTFLRGAASYVCSNEGPSDWPGGVEEDCAC
jgi:hypothetical protein